MKKIILTLLVCVIAVFAVTLSACSADVTIQSGESAYDIAVRHGFDGTEEEWLESLVGEKGEQGNDGQNGANGKNGIDGIDGTDGTDGASAYEIFITYHPEYIGTEEQWIDDLANGRLSDDKRLVFEETADGYAVAWNNEKKNYSGEIVIPSTFNGLPVVGINAHAFSSCTGITAVQIPDSVKTIGDGVFYNCENITKITIPASVTAMGRMAFSRCTSLSEVIFEEGSQIEIIDISSFQETAIESITLPQGIKTISDAAFARCVNLKSINLPNSLETIGGVAFLGCDNLTNITIPANVKHVGKGAFSNSGGEQTITVMGHKDYLSTMFAEWERSWNADGSNEAQTEIIYVPGEDYAEPHAIVGSWKTENEIYTFHIDNTLLVDRGGEILTGTYTIGGDNLSINIELPDGQTEVIQGTFELGGGVLTVHTAEEIIVFVPDFVGTWIGLKEDGHLVKLMLREDSTYTLLNYDAGGYFILPGTYTVSDTLPNTISLQFDGENDIETRGEAVFNAETHAFAFTLYFNGTESTAVLQYIP